MSMGSDMKEQIRQLKEYGYRLQSAESTAKKASEIPLLTPEVLEKLSGMLSPYWNQQRQAYGTQFNTALNNQMSRAQTQAAAQARYYGYRPGSYTHSAASGVRESMLPGYFQGLENLETSNLGSLYSLAPQYQQFERSGLTGLSGTQFNVAQLYEQMRQFNQQMAASQPSFWDYLLAPVSAFAGGAARGIFG